MNPIYLILKGCAGLGNRLITIANALNYSAKTDELFSSIGAMGNLDLKESMFFISTFKFQKHPILSPSLT